VENVVIVVRQEPRFLLLVILKTMGQNIGRSFRAVTALFEIGIGEGGQRMKLNFNVGTETVVDGVGQYANMD